VIGTVAEPQGGTTTDVYIPLQRAQSLAGMTGQVNTIYVAAASAADITAVQQAIKGQLPKATVTTSSDLASQVTGSLTSASSLAGSLGKWLAIVVLIAAFAMASLLTMAAVSRRVREFGTLKALGWRSRRIVGQMMGETLVIGVAGGVAGIALGCAGAARCRCSWGRCRRRSASPPGPRPPGSGRRAAGSVAAAGSVGAARSAGWRTMRPRPSWSTSTRRSRSASSRSP
jgi:FtsX-like permease family